MPTSRDIGKSPANGGTMFTQCRSPWWCPCTLGRRHIGDRAGTGSFGLPKALLPSGCPHGHPRGHELPHPPAPWTSASRLRSSPATPAASLAPWLPDSALRFLEDGSTPTPTTSQTLKVGGPTQACFPSPARGPSLCCCASPPNSLCVLKCQE